MAKLAKNTDGEREALIEAIAAETVAVGYGNLSVERITARAGLPPLAFDASFPDLRAGVAAAHTAIFECFFARLAQTCETQRAWPLKVKVGIGFTLDLAAASPIKARFLTDAGLAVDEALARPTMESRDRLARLLAPSGAQAPRPLRPPRITEQALVAGVTGVISGRLFNGEAEFLPALAPELVELTLLPYLGAEAAASVARRPRPQIDDL
ncbi:MAG: TetR/AcrR family transcriptional regulator [Solirubrobacterales bacterium]